MSSILPKNELDFFNFCPSLLASFLKELKKTQSLFEINWPLVVNFYFWKLRWLLCGLFSVEQMKIFHLEYLTAMCAWIDNLYISIHGIDKMNYKSNQYSGQNFLAVGRNYYVSVIAICNDPIPHFWYVSEKKK